MGRRSRKNAKPSSAVVANDANAALLAEDEDEDVAKEVVRVDGGANQDDVVVVKHLRKVYPSGLVAVHDLTFGIKRGDVFALLGVNGAGKSTTLKILSGEVLPTSGTATLDGLDILLEQARVRRMIGYCPQFDALLDLLTVREHLELFGRLKGVPEKQLNSKVKKKMSELRLLEFEHRLAGTLSGGNKRKLSVAIALIGDPPLILADEPTTGVDALNRRFLCDVIADYSINRSKGAVVLTTHSMEEVEALGTRVGILSGGRFKCLGSIQHLKNRFGKGIVFRARLAPADSNKIEMFLTKLKRETKVLNSEQALQRCCGVFGNPGRYERMTSEDPTGWVIRSALDRDGVVDPKMFAQWWISEDDGDRFQRFVLDNFPKAELTEKRPSQFVYRLLELDLSLGKCFSLFEASKSECKVQEYSVAGTSLESIFIALAQQQVEHAK
jgi:ATP-binding cassette subfamily A (ABC1) protein 1